MAALNSPEGTPAEVFYSQFFESSQLVLPSFHYKNNKEVIEEALCTRLWNMAVEYTRRYTRGGIHACFRDRSVILVIS